MALRALVILAAALLAAVSVPAARAQAVAPPSAPAYDPLKTFAPLTLPQPAGRTRGDAGTPGPDYWQNRADYHIDARLDPLAKLLSGEVVIPYTNNSPDTLDALWLQLDQNIYRPDSRGAAMGGGRPRHEFTDGYAIEAVQVEAGGRPVTPDHLISDKRVGVALP